MNSEVKRKWIEALRSGEYKQGYGTLRSRTDDGDAYHCCLGVLCEIAVEEGVIEVTEIDSTNSVVAVFGGAIDLLPYSVQKWADIPTDGCFDPWSEDGSPSGEPEQGHWSLASMNDSKKFGFNQIADVIDKRF